MNPNVISAKNIYVKKRHISRYYSFRPIYFVVFFQEYFVFEILYGSYNQLQNYKSWTFIIFLTDQIIIGHHDIKKRIHEFKVLQKVF